MKKHISSLAILAILLISNLAFGQYNIKGLLLDENSREPLMFAAVAIKGKDRGTTTDENGKFEFKIREKYYQDTLTFHLLGYEAKNIPIPYILTNPEELTFYLSSTAFDLVVAEVGASIILNNVSFEFNKHKLLDESEPELNKIYNYLEKHEDISIEISGHTDSIGSDAYNLALSEARASAVVAWLEEKGIDQRRMVARGYGETRPIVSNQTEEGQQENRRVEFLIIKKGEETIENKKTTDFQEKNNSNEEPEMIIIGGKNNNTAKEPEPKRLPPKNTTTKDPIAIYIKNDGQNSKKPVKEVEPSTQKLEQEKPEVLAVLDDKKTDTKELETADPEVIITIDGAMNEAKGTSEPPVKKEKTEPIKKEMVEVMPKNAVSLSDIYKITGFNGAVLAANTTDVILKEGVGFANATWEIENTTTTKFPMGAMTEQMTALLLFQLIDKEKIQLNAPVSMYLPSFSDLPDLTVRHLLVHSSGLVLADSVAEVTPEILTQYPLRFMPGTKYEHNSLNYYLLSLILELKTEIAYNQLVQEEILNPLGMSATNVWEPQMVDKQRASTYTKKEEELFNQPIEAKHLIIGANNMVTTVEDAHKWLMAIDKNIDFQQRFQAILPATSWDKAESGWFTYPNGIACFTKAKGYETFIFQTDDKSVILFSNVGDANLPTVAKFVLATMK